MSEGLARDLRSPVALALLVVLAGAAALHAPLFGGYWLGDDFSNLYQLHDWARQDRFWLESARRFVTAGDPQSAFYRPLMMLSLFMNYAVAGMHYGGWFAANFAVHLANAVMVAALVQRLAAWCGREAGLAAPLAAAWFVLDPIPFEGVYWVSARADAVVTLLSLLCLWLWAGPPGTQSPRARWLPPLLLALALGFKESAAVLPLQLGLVALAWPARLTRAQLQGWAGAFALMLAFLAARAYVFGDAWNVYHGPQRAGLVEAIASLPAWWLGLTDVAPGLATAHLALSTLALVCALVALRGTQARMVLALLVAGGGFALATLLNLGALSAHGDGGRLAYAPLAWLALALGVALSRNLPRNLPEVGSWVGLRPVSPNPSPALPEHRGGGFHASVDGATEATISFSRHPDQALRPRIAALGAVAMLLAFVAGAGVLHAQVHHVRSAQDSVRALVAAIPAWAGMHPGLTVLVVPERAGPVVALRNAQGAITMRPFQRKALLHRVLPTLDSELAVREAQLAAGLGTRLALLEPDHLDQNIMAALLAPTPTRAPAHAACWSPARQTIVEGCTIGAPDLACAAAACRAQVELD